MSYRDFYKISKFLNETDEIEIACLAYEYKKYCYRLCNIKFIKNMHRIDI